MQELRKEPSTGPSLGQDTNGKNGTEPPTLNKYLKFSCLVQVIPAKILLSYGAKSILVNQKFLSMQILSIRERLKRISLATSKAFLKAMDC